MTYLETYDWLRLVKVVEPWIIFEDLSHNAVRCRTTGQSHFFESLVEPLINPDLNIFGITKNTFICTRYRLPPASVNRIYDNK